MRQFKSPGARDFVVLDHASESDGQGFAAGMRGLPTDYIPVDFRSVGVEVSTEKDFLRIPLEPVANHLAQRARGDKPRLLGEVGIDVRLHQQVRNIFRERSRAAMEQNKLRLAQ